MTVFTRSATVTLAALLLTLPPGPARRERPNVKAVVRGGVLRTIEELRAAVASEAAKRP